VSPALLRYADWLFARALKLRESCDVESAETFEQRALAYLDQAEPDEQRASDAK
jgi:hypothetical protein